MAAGGVGAPGAATAPRGGGAAVAVARAGAATTVVLHGGAGATTVARALTRAAVWGLARIHVWPTGCLGPDVCVSMSGRVPPRAALWGGAGLCLKGPPASSVVKCRPPIGGEAVHSRFSHPIL